MKLLIIYVFAICQAMPKSEKEADIVSQTQIKDEHGYKFAFETSNGIAQSETGETKTSETGVDFVTKTGFYAYIDTNNLLRTVEYIADENGFRSTQRLNDLDDRIGSKLLLSLNGG